MDEPTLCAIAHTIGWRIERITLGSKPRVRWRLTTHVASRTHDTLAQAAKPVMIALHVAWMNAQGRERLLAILEDSAHPQHAATRAWLARNDPLAEDAAWQLAFDGAEYQVVRAAPREWTVAMASDLEIDMVFEGALLRAVGKKLAEQSADDLIKSLGAVTTVAGGRARL